MLMMSTVKSVATGMTAGVMGIGTLVSGLSDKCMTTPMEEIAIGTGTVVGTAGAVTWAVGSTMAANTALVSGATVVVAETVVFTGVVATMAKVAMVGGAVLVVGGVTSGFIRGIRAGIKVSV